jgi:hypothetical protein
MLDKNLTRKLEKCIELFGIDFLTTLDYFLTDNIESSSVEHICTDGTVNLEQESYSPTV